MRQRGLGITWSGNWCTLKLHPGLALAAVGVCTVQGCGCPLRLHLLRLRCVCVRVWPVWLALARCRYAADTAARNGKRRRNLWEALSLPTHLSPPSSPNTHTLWLPRYPVRAACSLCPHDTPLPPLDRGQLHNAPGLLPQPQTTLQQPRRPRSQTGRAPPSATPSIPARPLPIL